MAAEGTTTIAHTGFLLKLVYEVKALLGLLMVKIVKVERLQKENQTTDDLTSIHKSGERKDGGAKKRRQVQEGKNGELKR